MPALESTAQVAYRRSWEERRTWKNLWTKTDSARWLDDRTADAGPWIAKNLPAKGPSGKPIRPSKNFGQRLQQQHRDVFNRVHELIAAAGPGRDRMTLGDVLP